MLRPSHVPLCCTVCTCLNNIQNICKFLGYDFLSQIHHLNPTMLRTGGFGVITVCRPLEKERLLKELSPSLRNIAILVEDSAILSAELERTSSTMVRVSGRRNAQTLEKRNRLCSLFLGSHDLEMWRVRIVALKAPSSHEG